jgi:hypothetical protein
MSLLINQTSKEAYMSKKNDKNRVRNLFEKMRQQRCDVIIAPIEARTYNHRDESFGPWEKDKDWGERIFSSPEDECFPKLNSSRYDWMGEGVGRSYRWSASYGIGLTEEEDQPPVVVQRRPPETITIYRSNYLDQPVSEAYLGELRSKLAAAEEAQQKGKSLRSLLLGEEEEQREAKWLEEVEKKTPSNPNSQHHSEYSRFAAWDKFQSPHKHTNYGASELTDYLYGEKSAQEAYEHILVEELRKAQSVFEDKCAVSQAKVDAEDIWGGVE